MTMRVEWDLPPERNAPCNLLVEVVGDVQVDQTVTDENIERFIRINGSSLVFSATREIVRAITSRGPSRAVLLPTVTFWEPKPVQPASQPEVRTSQPEHASVVAEKAP